MDDAVTANDKLIWDLSTGTRITAVKDLVMEESGEVAFKAGTTYRVNSMHPIAAPAFIVLTNDQGQPHRLEGSDVRAYFGTFKERTEP